VTTAFWDTSALVPLCVRQKPSPAVRRLLKQYGIVVWWATSVEMRSAFESLLRMEQLSASEHAAAGLRLKRLRSGWREMQPSETLRSQAEIFLLRFPLRAADALQLAAAWIWSSGTPQQCVFISADAQLLEAAQKLEFQIISA
jgi:predicted nucleic acid-binding protein